MGRKKKIKNAAIRLLLIGLSVMLLMQGLDALIKGDWSYRPAYWGGPVFGGTAILIAVLLLYLTIFRWRELKKPFIDKKGKPFRFPGDEI